MRLGAPRPMNYWWSGRTMARTGLRMMPTFPSPPLKSRTVGFPQYGFKASMSDGTFLIGTRLSLLPTCPHVRSVCRRPAHTSVTAGSLGLSPGPSALPCAAVRRASAPLPQGSLAPARVMLSRAIIAYYDPMRRSRRHAAISLLAYTQRLRCAGAPRRPAGPSLLLLPCFPHMPSTLTRWPTVPSRCPHTVIPGFLEFLTSRQPQCPSLPAIPDGVAYFGAASFSLCYGLRVCLALLAGYDMMKSYVLHLAF